MVSMYIKIPIESLRSDTVVDFDIYLQRNEDAVLYREANLPFRDNEKEKLKESKVKEVLINRIDKKKYFNYIEKNIDKIIEDKSVSSDRKASLVYGTSKEIVTDILENPRSGENIKRAGDIITSTMNFILSDKTSFGYILSVTSYDYYTYTHSINVGLFVIALGNKLKIKEQKEIHALGWSGILHDIGKTSINNKIVNKNGPLTDEEFEQMKKHPIYGYEILKEAGQVPVSSCNGVLEHHEKANGKGYPNGLSLKDISYFGRIMAVADVFDALTTRRSYKPALETFKALSVMKNMEGHFDNNIFKSFVFLMGEQ